MPSRKRTATFFLLTLFFSSWFLDQGQNANTVSRAAMVAAVVEQGTLRIDQFTALTKDRALVDGHYYSEKAPLPAVLVIPFHWLLHHAGLIGASDATHINLDLLRLGGLLCGSIPFALIITLCWLHLARSTTPARAHLLTWATFFGSFLFVYSGSFYGHLIGAAFTLGALIALERAQHRSAGALIGCAVLCEYTIAIFAVCWTAHLALRWTRKGGMAAPLLHFVSGALPFAIALILYNTLLFGGPFHMGYAHVDSYQPEGGSMIERLRPEALWGLSLSPYRGLLPYMPVLALSIPAWWIASGRTRRAMGLLVSAPALLTFLFTASVGMWWGGWAFGPRHLTVVAVLLAYRTLPRLACATWAQIPFVALAVFGLAQTFLAKATVGYSLPTGIQQPMREIILPAILRLDITNGQWPVLLGLRPSVATALFIVSFALVLAWSTKRSRLTHHAPVPLP